jgi:hypothetical protein
VANKFVSPRLNAAFMVKLRELAKLIKKLRGEAADPAGWQKSRDCKFIATCAKWQEKN